MCVYLCEFVYVEHMCAGAHRSQKLVFYPVRIIDSCEMPSVGAENRTPVLCSNSKCSSCLPVSPAPHVCVCACAHVCGL